MDTSRTDRVSRERRLRLLSPFELYVSSLCLENALFGKDRSRSSSEVIREEAEAFNASPFRFGESFNTTVRMTSWAMESKKDAYSLDNQNFETSFEKAFYAFVLNEDNEDKSSDDKNKSTDDDKNKSTDDDDNDDNRTIDDGECYFKFKRIIYRIIYTCVSMDSSTFAIFFRVCVNRIVVR